MGRSLRCLTRVLSEVSDFMTTIQKRSFTTSKVLTVSFLLAAGYATVSCSPSFEGEYSDPTRAEIVDDKWNETDARKTAETMIKGVLGRPWLKDFTHKHKGKPVVFVDDVENRTDEHIDTKALTEFIRNELINSGKVKFVDAARRQKILDEIKYQNSGAVSGETAKKAGRQTGADYLMAGAISSSVHTMEGAKTVTYQTNLILTNLETSEIEWTDKYEIKKRFRRSGAGW